MAGRTTGNKRQREQLRRERMAEKLSKRDARRARRNAGDIASPDVEELEPLDAAPAGDLPSPDQAPSSSAAEGANHAGAAE